MMRNSGPPDNAQDRWYLSRHLSWERRLTSRRVFWLGLVAAIIGLGCGWVGIGPSDEELVDRTIVEWSEAIAAGDIERLMATYSEDFSCFDAPDREAMRVMVSQLKNRRSLEGVEVFIDKAEKTPANGVIRVFPVEMFGPKIYPPTYRLTLKKERGKWLIVDQEW
jgi:hypothetical protein